MPVYVDQLKYQRRVSREARRYGDRWCHLFADSLAELHEFAGRLRLRRSYFQNSSVRPHYDLTPNKRSQALGLGARTATTKEMLRPRPDGRSAAGVLPRHQPLVAEWPPAQGRPKPSSA